MHAPNIEKKHANIVPYIKRLKSFQKIVRIVIVTS